MSAFCEGQFYQLEQASILLAHGKQSVGNLYLSGSCNHAVAVPHSFLPQPFRFIRFAGSRVSGIGWVRPSYSKSLPIMKYSHPSIAVLVPF